MTPNDTGYLTLKGVPYMADGVKVTYRNLFRAGRRDFCGASAQNRMKCHAA